MSTNNNEVSKVNVETQDNLRHLEGNWLLLFKFVGLTWCAYQIAVSAGLIFPIAYAHRAIHLAFALTMVFLIYPFSKKTGSNLPWYDILIPIVGLVFTGYVFYMQQFKQDVLIYRTAETTSVEMVLGVLAILVILEATRRVMGIVLPVIVLIFLSYGYLSAFMPGTLATRGFSLERIISHIYVTNNGIWGLVLGVSAKEVFMFVLFASIFAFSGVGEMLIKLAMGWFGGVRGGPAKVGIIASAFFGTLSGSAVANILTTGAFTIPLMKKVGYSSRFAAAVEACASTGGMFTPPFMGAAAFVMAQFLGVSYGEIIVMAIIPAFLFYAALFFAIDIEAQKKKLMGLPRHELPNPMRTLREGWILFLPLVLLVYLLVFKNYSPDRAALFGILSSILVYLIQHRKSLSLGKFTDSFVKGAQNAVTVAVTTAAIGMVVGMIELTGLGVKLSSVLIQLSGGSIPVLLLLTMFASIILGLGLTPAACYITLAILVAPTLIDMGITPLAAHFFVFMFGIMGMITPPVAISSYVAASLAGSNLFNTGLTAFRIAFPSFIVPFMFAYGPTLLGIGTPLAIINSLITATIGIWAFASTIQGWVKERAKLWERGLLLLCAIMLIDPGIKGDIIGIGVLAVVVLYHYMRIRAKNPREKDKIINESGA